MAHLRDSSLGRSHAVKEAPLVGTDDVFCLFQPRPCRSLLIAGPAVRLRRSASWVVNFAPEITHNPCRVVSAAVLTTPFRGFGLDASYSFVAELALITLGAVDRHFAETCEPQRPALAGKRAPAALDTAHLSHCLGARRVHDGRRLPGLTRVGLSGYLENRPRPK